MEWEHVHDFKHGNLVDGTLFYSAFLFYWFVGGDGGGGAACKMIMKSKIAKIQNSRKYNSFRVTNIINDKIRRKRRGQNEWTDKWMEWSWRRGCRKKKEEENQSEQT